MTQTHGANMPNMSPVPLTLFVCIDHALALQTTNDDFILASCSSVNSRTSKASSHSTNVMCVVVLLTADRNLRVKAHAAGVPVRDFPSFMAWVKPALKLKEIK